MEAGRVGEEGKGLEGGMKVAFPLSHSVKRAEGRAEGWMDGRMDGCNGQI